MSFPSSYLAQCIAGLDADLATEIEAVEIPRVALVETENLRAVTEAELHWGTAIPQARQDGSLSWNAPSPTA